MTVLVEACEQGERGGGRIGDDGMARAMLSGGSGNSSFPNLADVKYLWNVWEIHFLILLSLFLQVVLFLFAGMRSRSSSRILRSVLWLAYLSADSVAIFVLGHLVIHAEGPRHHLMYFWAPFVLVHLGGQDTITAFSKQDNQLWRRHLLNLVTQVAVAGYVVAKASWPDRRLLAAMVIMFLSGCIKYVERILCLLFSSQLEHGFLTVLHLYDALQKLKATHGQEDDDTIKDEVELAQRDMVQTLDKMLKGCWSWGGTDVIDAIMSEDAPHSKVWRILIADDISGMLAEFKSRAGRLGAYKYVGAYLVDCYAELHTKSPVRVFLPTRPTIRSRRVKVTKKMGSCFGIGYAFFLLYHIFLHVLAPAALVLFMASEKGDRLDTSRADITVSYILLVGAIILDGCSFFYSLGYLLTDSWIRNAIFCVLNYIKPAGSRKQWSEELAQYSIIKSCTPKSSTYKNFAAWLFGTQTHVPITKKHTPIKEFILDYLLCLGARKEWDITNSRGKLALRNWMDSHQEDPDSAARAGKALERSITADFPLSVLIWHIATDMCYYCGDDLTADTDQMNNDNKQVSRELSNYIMYLIFECGVKRTTSTQLVHDRAGLEIRKIFKTKRGRQVNLDDEKDVVREQFDHKEEVQQDSVAIEVQKLQELGDEQHSTVTEIQKTPELDDEQHHSSVVTEIRRHEELLGKEQGDSMITEIQEPTEQTTNKMQKLVRSTLEDLDPPVLPRARELARDLLGIKDAAERWVLIVGVWSEMLFYAAPRCGSAFHYEHLSTGGEFVTHVLVLMRLLGPFLPPPGS